LRTRITMQQRPHWGQNHQLDATNEHKGFTPTPVCRRTATQKNAIAHPRH
jgi:hypothetical protein